jgi:hemolysin activation/secretion protein
LEPYLGPGGSIERVDAARVALEASYHQRGWLSVAVSIPEQRVDEGSVTLRVTEAALDRVVVRGALFFAPSAIKAMVPELTEQKVPNFPQLQTELAALGAVSDLRVTPILRPGSAPGTLDAVLDVEDNLPFHGTVELNNRQAPNTSPTRLAASLRTENLFQSRHTAGILLQAAPEVRDQMHVVALSYGIPLRAPGESIGLSYVQSRSRLARLSGADGLGLLGNADIFGTRWNKPLPAGEGLTQSLAVGADYRRLGQTILVDGEPGVATPVRYLPLSITYTLNAVEGPWPWVVEASSSLGVRGLVGSDTTFNARRAGTSANFQTLRLGLGGSHRFAGWELAGRLDTQWSGAPLIGNEQFLVGGAQSVRGYLEGEAAGDVGQRWSLELRSPSQAWGSASTGWKWVGLGFVEGAGVRTLAAGTAAASQRQLLGLGLGLRLSLPKGFSVELDAAQALRDATVTRADDVRVHVRAVYSD